MMHHDHANDVTVEDLWPGDVIIARRPGEYIQMPHRFVVAEETDEGRVIVRFTSLDQQSEFALLAPGGWGTPVERV